MIHVDGTGLTLADIAGAAAVPARVRLTEAATARVAASHEFAELAASGRPIYGRSTGVGANRVLALSDPDVQAIDLLRSHATSAGAPRSPERVRAMLLIRLNQLAAGNSGASPGVLEALAAMIESDALPAVRELGSIGTGDMSALAATALALHDRVPFGRGDALPFISSNAATIADAALALDGLRSLARATLVVAAVSFDGVRGNAEAFSPAVESITPFPGARTVCRTVRELIGTGREPARIQDPFGLRALPQVHGALLDGLDHLEAVVLTLANTGSENPTLSPDLGVAHHGGFYVAGLAQLLDLVKLATAQTAQLALDRLTMLDEPALTGLEPFLGDGTPGASGTMIVEYVSASALAELRALATPASLHTTTLSRGVEEDASFASQAARQALDAVAHFRTVLAAELVAAVRCARLHEQRDQQAGATGHQVLRLCSGLSSSMHDRDLTDDLDLAHELVDQLAGLID